MSEIKLTKMKITRAEVVDLVSTVSLTNKMLGSAYNLMQSAVQDNIAAMIEIAPESTLSFLEKLCNEERNKSITDHVEKLKTIHEDLKNEFETRIELGE